MNRKVSPTEAKAIVHGGQEIAFLDLSEAGQFGEGHPLFAVPCPFSILEERIPALVPRASTPLLLIDAGDGVAERAAHRIAAMGYSDIAIVSGGTPAWAGAGYTLFKGVNVPSKTLGELAEHVWHPPVVSPNTIKVWLSQGSAQLFDGRPPAEYRKMHVPGAVCMPNGELAHRLAAILRSRSAAQPLVVGCAGRTRGIVGAIGVMLAGHDGPVYALENGTQGWALAGEELERGVGAAPFPELSAAEKEETRLRADAFAERWGIALAGADDIRTMMADETRTTFMFDVRSIDEAEDDPIPAAPHAPSGQIVQASDQYIGVRHARIVLCDDLGMRACLAAFWLRQLGFDPVVARIDEDVRKIAPNDKLRPAFAPKASLINARDAAELVKTEAATLLDGRSSQAFRAGHVEGAIWVTRARLASSLERAGSGKRLLLLAEDEAVQHCLLHDLKDTTSCEVSLVEDGQDGLTAAGAPTIATPNEPNDEEAIDFLSFVHDRHDGNLEASRRYLAWETGLIAQLDTDERAEFRLTSKPRS